MMKVVGPQKDAQRYTEDLTYNFRRFMDSQSRTVHSSLNEKFSRPIRMVVVGGEVETD